MGSLFRLFLAGGFKPVKIIPTPYCVTGMINNTNNLEKEWREATGQNPDAPNPLRTALSIERKYLNVPFTDVVSPPEADGLPFVSHSPEHTAPFLSQHAATREAYHRRLEELTSTWGPSIPCKVDLDRLQEVTQQLIQGALAGDVPKVKRALQEGANPDTLVLVRDVCAKNPQYVAAPLGVACAMYHAQTKDRLMQDAHKAIVRLLLVRDGKSVVDIGPSPETSSMSAGFSLPGITWGGEHEYRQVPLTFAQSSTLAKFVPEGLDNGVKYISGGVAYGEELPKEMKDTYMDLYDPSRDTLVDAIACFREQRAKMQAQAPNKPRIKP